MSEPRASTGTIRCPVCDTPPSRAGADVVHAEPVTHCEWCGAEYPLPESSRVEGAPAEPAEDEQG
jgi:hypothetical protein